MNAPLEVTVKWERANDADCDSSDNFMTPEERFLK